MSPRKKLCTPRFTAAVEQKDLEERKESVASQCASNDVQRPVLKTQKSNGQSTPLPCVKSNKIALVQTKRNTLAKVKRIETNITRASDFFNRNQDNDNLNIYSVCTGDNLLQKMGTAAQPNQTEEPHTQPAAQFPSTDVFKEIWRESLVWKYFNNVQGGASCRVCGRILKISSRGTLNLEHHLFMRHRPEYVIFQQECTAGIGGVTPTMKQPIRTYSRVRKPLEMPGSHPAAPACTQVVVQEQKPDQTAPQQLPIKMEREDESLHSLASPQELISQSDNKEELIDLYSFGNFNKKSLTLDDSSTGTGAVKAKMNLYYRQRTKKPLLQAKEPSRSGVNKARVERCKLLPAISDHAYAILQRYEEPYVQRSKLLLSRLTMPQHQWQNRPVKKEVEECEENLDLIVPDALSEDDVDIIVPDPCSASQYPQWLKKEPEDVAVELPPQKGANSEPCSPSQQNIPAITIKTEPAEEEILG